MRFNMKQLQQEQREWSLRNFGAHPPEDPFLGMVEELGEIEEAETIDELNDGAADFVIFMVDLASCLNIDMGAVEELARTAMFDTDDIGGLLSSDVRVAMGRVSRAILKSKQGIRGTREEHVRVVADNLPILLAHAVEEISCDMDWDKFLSVVEGVWTGVVKKRDWTIREAVR